LIFHPAAVDETVAVFAAEPFLAAQFFCDHGWWSPRATKRCDDIAKCSAWLREMMRENKFVDEMRRWTDYLWRLAWSRKLTGMTQEL
jgi:hypothetical protein